MLKPEYRVSLRFISKSVLQEVQLVINLVTFQETKTFTHKAINPFQDEISSGPKMAKQRTIPKPKVIKNSVA